MTATLDPPSARSTDEVDPGSPDKLAWWAHLASLGVAAVLFTYLGRRQWFFADEWEFITNRGLSHPRADIWIPHTQHWSTGPILIDRLLLNLFGLHTYLPYLLAVIAAHLLIVHLLWRVMRRAGVDDWVATGTCVLFLVAAVGWSQIFWGFQTSYDGSVALGLIVLLLVDGPLSWRRGALACGVAIVSLTFSSVSLPILIAAGLLCWLRHGLRTGVAVFGPPALVYLLWDFFIGRKPVAGITDGTNTIKLSASVVARVPWFTVRLLAYSLGELTRVRSLGYVLLAAVLVAAVVWLRPRWQGRAAIALASALAGLGFVGLTALGRVSSGAADPDQSRYLYVTGALVLPLAALALTWLWRRGKVAQVALAALLAVLVVTNLIGMRSKVDAQDLIDGAIRQRVLIAADLIRSGQPTIADQEVEPTYDPDLTVGKLGKLIRSGWVPSSSSADPQARLLVRTNVQMSVTTGPIFPMGAPGAPTVSNTHGATVSAGEPGCRTFTATAHGSAVVLLSVTSVHSLQVRVPRDTTLSLGLGAAGVYLPDVRQVAIAAGPASYLNLATTDAQPIIGVPAGHRVTLCGLGPSSST